MAACACLIVAAGSRVSCCWSIRPSGSGRLRQGMASTRATRAAPSKHANSSARRHGLRSTVPEECGRGGTLMSAGKLRAWQPVGDTGGHALELRAQRTGCAVRSPGGPAIAMQHLVRRQNPLGEGTLLHDSAIRPPRSAVPQLAIRAGSSARCGPIPDATWVRAATAPPHIPRNAPCARAPAVLAPWRSG